MSSVAARQKMPPAVGRGRDNGLFLCIPASAHTLAGFRAWVLSDDFPEKGVRVTFISGEVYLDMSLEELETHAKVKSEVCRVLLNLNHESKLGILYLDGVLISNEEADVSNNPDATLLSRKSIRSGRVRQVPRKGEEGEYMEIEGTPDWVLEIVSKWSAKKDAQRLREAYHRAGIPEYWLINARGEAIDFQVLLWRKKGYTAAPVRDGWQKSRVFGREFRLARERDDLGLWEYTLEARAPSP